MRSAVAVTTEIDDTLAAARELAGAVTRQLTPGKSSCGILYYDYEMDGDRLGGYLTQMLGMDVIGCSVVAALEGRQGYHAMAAVLTVLTGDDCEFSAVISEPLSPATAAHAMYDAYEMARARLTQTPRLLFVIPPCGADIPLDTHLEALSQRIDRLPIFGGVPSSTGSSEKSVMVNGRFYTDRTAMLVIGGAVRPVFSLANVISTFADKSCTISRVEGNVILRVNGESSFVDFMKSYGLDIHSIAENEDRVFFQKYPLRISDPSHAQASRLPYVRILKEFDLARGSGVTYASVPEGATASLGVLRKEDIAASAGDGINGLLQQMEKSSAEGAAYSTVFCISCAARHVIMTPAHDSEARRITETLPDSLNLSGFYSYGEICPIAVVDGKAINLLHNASVVFCAL